MFIPWGKMLSLVPKSKSPVKVKVKYQGHSFLKNGHCVGIHVSQTQLCCFLLQRVENIVVGKKKEKVVVTSIFSFFQNVYKKTFHSWSLQVGIVL